MGDQLYLERFVWFDHEARKERYPNAFKLGDHFEISVKTAQRSIDHFRDRLLAPLEYEKSHKGYYYTDPTFQLPLIKISEEELLALLANIEGMNAEIIYMGLSQGDRLKRLNEIAIRQMQVLTSVAAIKQLKE